MRSFPVSLGGLGRLLVLALVAMPLLTSCVSRGFPSHGGGKRFFREQDIVSRAVRNAVESLEFADIKTAANKESGSPAVGLYIYSVEDSGGGAMAGGGGGLGSLFSSLGLVGAATGNEDMAVAGGAGMTAAAISSAASSAYGSFAFETSDDLAYLKGVVLQNMTASNISVASLTVEGVDGDGKSMAQPQAPDGYVFVLVDQFGIDQSGLNVLVYTEKSLKARVRVRAFFVYEESAGDGTVITKLADLGTGESEWEYDEAFILGIGPIGETEPKQTYNRDD